MPRGGYRPGAGRPKGSRTQSRAPAAPAAVAKPKRKLAAGGKAKAGTVAPSEKLARTPLEYMLDVMNDPDADQARRDRMAIAAAGFMHSRAAGRDRERPAGKKEQAIDAAKKTGVGRFATPAPPPRLVVDNRS